MKEVDKVDKVLGFFSSQTSDRADRTTNQVALESLLEAFSQIWRIKNPNKDFYKDTNDGFLLGCGLAGIPIPILNFTLTM